MFGFIFYKKKLNILLYNRERVQVVDDRLRKLVDNSTEPTPEDYSLGSEPATSNETKLKSVKDIERATHISIDVRQPCGGNFGRGLTLVTIVHNRVDDFARRRLIRNTFGGALKQNSNSAIYFIVAKSNDSR